MIRLPNTGTYSLELITAQNGAQSVVSYSDATSSAYTGGTQVASITSATTTTICSTPAASTVRDVDQINIKNTFAGSHTVTVQVDANGTNYPLIVAALLTDESLNYTHGSGWQVKDANGNTKTSPLTSMTSAQLAAILTDETGSGAAVFANGPTLIAPILGTPASGTVTNLTGTASININGTVGATTPAAGTFTTLTSTGNATLGDAEATDTHAIKGATTLLANSASAALTVTQTGAGNAFVVEDSASTDSTPVVIDAGGTTILNYTTDMGGGKLQVKDQNISIMSYGNSSFANGVFNSYKSRSTTPGSFTSVQNGDEIGFLFFRADDGTAFRTAAYIGASVDGTPGTNDMPGRITISVTADGASSPTEAFRIANDRTTTLGGTSTAPAFKVVPVASQNAWVTITGSNGADPILDVSAGSLSLAPSTVVKISASSASTIKLAGYASSTYIWGLGRSGANGLLYDSFDGHSFFGGSATGPVTGTEQVRITSTASANRYITLTGSNGGSPVIGTSAGSLALSPGGFPAIVGQAVASAANFLDVTPSIATNGYVTIAAAGSDTNINLVHSAKGTGVHAFYTAGVTSLQVIIGHTASATRYITLTGSNGGNPTIGTSGGTLALSAGALATSSTLGLGYGTGAGGTVTQLTSKATSVTLNTPCGRITMNNAALAASTTVGFSVNNSVFSDQDVVHLMIASGATSNSYNIWATRNSSGVFNIYVRNISGGSLSEAVELQFVIIKGANS